MIYTCPMHPEVQQDHPGDCPKCGMALEAKTVTAGMDGEENAESVHACGTPPFAASRRSIGPKS